MKNVNNLLRLVTFSEYSSLAQLEPLVQQQHEKWMERYPKWSHESTKQKLLSAYWTRIVPMHFFTLFSLVLVASFFFLFRLQNLTELVTIIFTTASITYIVLRVWIYNPNYLNEYIPLLNHVTEKLSGSYLKELDAVKKGQFSAVTIVLIQQVTNRLAGFPSLTGSKITKDKLAKLYGVSERSFHDALNIVLKASWKAGGRIDTEIADAFGDAREYFSAIGNKEAAKLLDDIKLDVLVKRQPPSY